MTGQAGEHAADERTVRNNPADTDADHRIPGSGSSRRGLRGRPAAATLMRRLMQFHSFRPGSPAPVLPAVPGAGGRARRGRRRHPAVPMTTEPTDLVSRLSTGSHPVAFRPRRDDAAAELREAVDRGYVHVTFTGTRGGTELGIPVDADASDLSGADWAGGTGTLHLEGELTLDGVRVRCIADLDVATLQGEGRLAAAAAV